MVPSSPILPLLFVYVALVSVLVTYVITRKILHANLSRNHNPANSTVVRLGEEETDGIPEEIAKQLSLMIRFIPPSGRAGDANARIVKIEERLMLSGTPLTSWVKHAEKITLDSQSIEQFSVLKLNRAVRKELARATITSNSG